MLLPGVLPRNTLRGVLLREGLCGANGVWPSSSAMDPMRDAIPTLQSPVTITLRRSIPCDQRDMVTARGHRRGDTHDRVPTLPAVSHCHQSEPTCAAGWDLGWTWVGPGWDLGGIWVGSWWDYLGWRYREVECKRCGCDGEGCVRQTRHPLGTARNLSGPRGGWAADSCERLTGRVLLCAPAVRRRERVKRR